jgi:protease I
LFLKKERINRPPLKFKFMATLAAKKVAIITEHGFEEAELTNPKQELEAAGAEVDIVSPQKDRVKA